MKRINEVSEKVMGMTIPFALGWGAVLTAVSAGVAVYEKKKDGNTAGEKAEESK